MVFFRLDCVIISVSFTYHHPTQTISKVCHVNKTCHLVTTSAPPVCLTINPQNVQLECDVSLVTFNRLHQAIVTLHHGKLNARRRLSAQTFTSFCSTDGRNVYDLSFSCFSSFSKHPDNVSVILDVGQKFHDASLMTPKPVTTHVAWPNEVEQVPDGIFPSNYYWTCSEGFMVGGKDNGRVSLWDMSRGPGAVDGVLTLTVDETGNKWFYHRVEWVDMDNDGLKDALTARAQSTGPTGNGQLIWFKNPGLMGGQVQEFWKENILHAGPDVYFRAVRLPLPNGGTKMAIVSTVFWGQQLTVTWTSGKLPSGSQYVLFACQSRHLVKRFSA
uniref:Uncharacterized protein LOC116953613 isoform X1 n=1 Tax=Petromyzon marinus TaxID=7757 RepID=A0AAJ7U7U3_PETMA|nr:uncharacterized protein LOC116953613 isoform X1 [Petromyzon marinus]